MSLTITNLGKVPTMTKRSPVRRAPPLAAITTVDPDRNISAQLREHQDIVSALRDNNRILAARISALEDLLHKHILIDASSLQREAQA
jgi:hypothetical protein